MSTILDSAGRQHADEAAFYDARWAKEFGQPIRGIKLQLSATVIQEIAGLQIREPAILEIGSGAGVLAGMLSGIGRVTGVELSPKAVEYASSRHPEVDFHAGDFFECRFEDRLFDLVVCQEVIEHVENQRGMLERIHELLRPGGHVILTTPNAYVAEKSGVLRKAKARSTLQPRENLLTRRALRALVSERFELLRLYSIVNSGRDGIFRIVNSPKLLRSRAWRQAVNAAGLGLHWVVVAQAR